MRIESISARIILNSLGDKALECKVTLDDRRVGIFAPPAGTSTGKYEAHVVPVDQALEQIKEMISDLLSLQPIDQTSLDEYLLSRKGLGANTTIAISVAHALAADILGLNSNIMKRKAFHMPQMMVLFFEGGMHAAGSISIQEFMVIYKDILQAAADFKQMKQHLTATGHLVNSGMEGAMVSDKLTEQQVFALLNGKEIALDVGGHYLENSETDIMSIPEQYSVVSVEDPYPEDDVSSWKRFYRQWGKQILVVGDDLTVTNSERIKQFAHNAINAVIIKLNQQKTLTDTLTAIKVAKENDLKTIISHRSGETNQTFIADLAIATKADFVKFGAPNRGERVLKYNRLLEFAK